MSWRGPATLSATIDGNPYNWALNNTFDVGTTVIIWKATDGCGHFTTAAQNVVIVDGQYPTIDCGDNQFVNADAGVCTATLVPTAPSFSDNCPGPVLTATINGDPYTPGTSHAFPRGLTEVHWRVTDAHGNATTCIHNVTVSDTQIPIFDTCPGPISENADAGGCTYTFSPVHPTFHDNCDANALITLTATLDGSPYDYVSFPSLTLDRKSVV